MKPCPQCGSDNADDYQFCLRCGRALLATGHDRTTPMPGPGLMVQPRLPVDVFTSRKGELHRAIAVTELFAGKHRLVIGRVATCDICLPHPSVSRRHAILERRP